MRAVPRGRERGRAFQAEGTECAEAQGLRRESLRNSNTGAWAYTRGAGLGEENTR